MTVADDSVADEDAVSVDATVEEVLLDAGARVDDETT